MEHMTESIIATFKSEGGNLCKTRRALIRKHRWRNDEWYRYWPEIAPVLESLLTSEAT